MLILRYLPLIDSSLFCHKRWTSTELCIPVFINQELSANLWIWSYITVKCFHDSYCCTQYQYMYLNMLILIKLLAMQNKMKWTSFIFWTLSNSELEKKSISKWVNYSIAGTQDQMELSEPINTFLWWKKIIYMYSDICIYMYTHMNGHNTGISLPIIRFHQFHALGSYLWCACMFLCLWTWLLWIFIFKVRILWFHVCVLFLLCIYHLWYFFWWTNFN